MIKEINEGDTSDTEKKITQYSYDLNGNLTKVIKPSGKEINYEYNSLNLPTKVIYDINNYTTFEYDENGNRKKMSDVSASGTSITSYAYDVNDRIIQYVQDGIALDYIYDNSNNVKKVQYKEGSIDREIEYIYDSFNRINSINLSGKKLREYLYIHSGLITKYYYDRGALLFTTGENTSLRATENILDPAGSIIASKRFDGNYENMYFFYNYDIRGSVTNIIAPDGNLVKGYSYDEFGNMEPVGDKNFLNDVTFTGAVHDTSTGLYYMNARFYNPSTGRFITQDSYSGNAYEPWTQHLYSYVGNNPVSMIDPTGHKAISITDSGGKELPPPEKSVSSRVDKVITGSFLIYLGYTALTVGIAVAGVATGGLAFVAVATAVAGAGLMAFGISDAVEGITGTNPLKEGLGFSEDKYYIAETLLTGGAYAGIAYCNAFKMPTDTGGSDKDKGGPPMPHCKSSLPGGCGLAVVAYDHMPLSCIKNRTEGSPRSWYEKCWSKRASKRPVNCDVSGTKRPSSIIC